MAMREARYWSRPGKPVEGMAACWAEARTERRATDASWATRRRGLRCMCTSRDRIPHTKHCGIAVERTWILPLHAVVVRSAAALGWDPGNDLIRVGDVAGLAVNAIRRVQANALRVGLSGVVNHFVDIGRAEILARVAEFFYAARIADVGVVNDEMSGLVLFMLGAGVVEVGELVESQFAVAFGRTDQASAVAALRGQFAEL